MTFARRVTSGREPAAAALSVLAVLSLLLMAEAASAWAAPCLPDHVPVELVFASSFERARLDHSKPAAVINQMFLRARKDASLERGGEAVGLTTTRSEFWFQTRTQVYRQNDGGYCVYLREVDAHLDQLDTILYVASEFPRGSCNFTVVYEHEKKHMRIHYRVLQDYAPQVKRVLKAALDDMGPLAVKSVADARDAYSTAINATANPVLEAMERERTRRNAALDSKENYALEQAKCPTW